MKDIPSQIDRLRKALGLNQTSFAKVVGVDQSTISKWQTGKDMPRGSALLKMNELAQQSGLPPIAIQSQTSARRRVWWGDFPTTEYSAIDPEVTIAVLPVAAIEQHGPHLPVSTDTTIMQGMLEAVIERLPADLDVRILPVQAVGKSNEHLHAPGTLTLPAATLIEAWTELGVSIARAGVKKLVVVNSHGGNEEIMGIVTRELRVRFGMLAVKTSWQRFGRPAGMYPELEDRHGIHGGDVETSLMLHFRPDLVDMTKAENFVSGVARAEQEFELLRHTGTHAFAWIASDLNSHGVVGNAAIATAEKGRWTAAHQAEGFVRLLQDVRKAKLADWLA